jgi:hypothetical protein
MLGVLIIIGEIEDLMASADQTHLDDGTTVLDTILANFVAALKVGSPKIDFTKFDALVKAAQAADPGVQPPVIRFTVGQLLPAGTVVPAAPVVVVDTTTANVLPPGSVIAAGTTGTVTVGG